MRYSVRSILLTILVLVAACSALALGPGAVGAQNEPRGNNTLDSIEATQQATPFSFGTPSLIPGDVPFDYGSVQTAEVPTARLFWTSADRKQRLSMHVYPRVEGSNLFRGNNESEGTQNVSINGQPGDYSEPMASDAAATLTFVSANETVYTLTSTANRSTLVRVAESIDTVSPPTQIEPANATSNTTPLANTLTIRSTADERVFYNATASEGMQPAAGADLSGASSPDTVTGSKASGSTAQGGLDNFTFAGNLTGLELRGGPARVLVNGEQVDPGSYSSVTTSPATTTTTVSTSAANTTSSRSVSTTAPTTTGTTTSVTSGTSSVASSTSPTPSNEPTTGGEVVSPGTTGGSSGSGPGFTGFAAAVAVLGTTFLVLRRRA